MVQVCSGDQKQCGHLLKRGLESGSSEMGSGSTAGGPLVTMKPELDHSRGETAVVLRASSYQIPTGTV